MRWEAVDREAREIRLRTSKNGRVQVIPYDGDLADLIARRAKARSFERSEGHSGISEYVFHHEGASVGEFKKAWAIACRKAGVPGTMSHDLRRTAVRNMIPAGVSDTVTMAVSGHRTRSMFDRYKHHQHAGP